MRDPDTVFLAWLRTLLIKKTLRPGVGFLIISWSPSIIFTPHVYRKKQKQFLFLRSKPFNAGQKDGSGHKFALFVFVTDVQQDVDEGMDHVEHM